MSSSASQSQNFTLPSQNDSPLGNIFSDSIIKRYHSTYIIRHFLSNRYIQNSKMILKNISSSNLVKLSNNKISTLLFGEYFSPCLSSQDITVDQISKSCNSQVSDFFSGVTDWRVRCGWCTIRKRIRLRHETQ